MDFRAYSVDAISPTAKIFLVFLVFQLLGCSGVFVNPDLLNEQGQKAKIPRSKVLPFTSSGKIDRTLKALKQDKVLGPEFIEYQNELLKNVIPFPNQERNAYFPEKTERRSTSQYEMTFSAKDWLANLVGDGVVISEVEHLTVREIVNIIMHDCLILALVENEFSHGLKNVNDVTDQIFYRYTAFSIVNGYSINSSRTDSSGVGKTEARPLLTVIFNTLDQFGWVMKEDETLYKRHFPMASIPGKHGTTRIFATYLVRPPGLSDSTFAAQFGISPTRVRGVDRNEGLPSGYYSYSITKGEDLTEKQRQIEEEKRRKQEEERQKQQRELERLQ